MPDPTRTIRYWGMLQQALRDVAAWAERGVPPPRETVYKVEKGQVVVPLTAADRKGIQPVVALKANGGVRAEAKTGQPITFTAVIESPPGGGSIVSADWAFETGPELVESLTNRYTASEQFAPAPRVTLRRRYTFTKPGTYFPALLVHSQREGNASTPYARIPNLGRVRVVVT